PLPHDPSFCLQFYMKNTKCRRHRLRVSNAGELKGRLAPEPALQVIPPGFIHTRTKTDSMSHSTKLPAHAHFTCLTDPTPNQAQKRVACPWVCPKPSSGLLFLLLNMSAVARHATAVARHAIAGPQLLLLLLRMLLLLLNSILRKNNPSRPRSRLVPQFLRPCRKLRHDSKRKHASPPPVLGRGIGGAISLGHMYGGTSFMPA
ncbi:unnamed protein product, partial [Ectocarpus sp. 12 AP-2014]